MVRRRRWNRKLISNIPVPVVFSVLKVLLKVTVEMAGLLVQ